VLFLAALGAGYAVVCGAVATTFAAAIAGRIAA
jgi:hypothetical protein